MEQVPEPAGAGDDAARVVALVEALGIKYGLERSFKVSRGKLLSDRVLIGFRKERIGGDADAAVLRLCERLSMPRALLAVYRERLPDAQYVHFGFERSDQRGVLKAYLEFYEKVQAEMHAQPGPHLMHLGFKWMQGGAQPLTTRYEWYPALAVDDMRARVARILGSSEPPAAPMEIADAVLAQAARKVRASDIFYLDVSEEGNPRRSFDINVYRARLRMEELAPALSQVCRRYGVERTFAGLYHRMRGNIFGHIAGGIDRQGEDFVTAYYGLEYRQPRR
jgi:hypothetical protein